MKVMYNGGNDARHALSLLAIDRFHLHLSGSGTVFLMTLHVRRHWQYFIE